MTVLLASFLCGAFIGLRLTVYGFLPLMLLSTALSFVLQGALEGVATLVALQVGYVCGALLRATLPARDRRPPLCRAVRRRA